jgi:hypothetical protein
MKTNLNDYWLLRNVCLENDFVDIRGQWVSGKGGGEEDGEGEKPQHPSEMSEM